MPPTHPARAAPRRRRQGLEAARGGLRPLVVEAHPVDEGAVLGEPEQAGPVVPGLRGGGDGARLAAGGGPVAPLGGEPEEEPAEGGPGHGGAWITPPGPLRSTLPRRPPPPPGVTAPARTPPPARRGSR